MAEKLDVIGGKLEKTAEGILLFICICVLGVLALYSAKYTMVENAGIPSDMRDNGWINFLILAVVTTVAALLHRTSRSRRFSFVNRRIRAWQPYIIGIASVLVYLISAVWVSNCHVEPCGDSGVLCSVAGQMMAGNYSAMEGAGSYMAVFPHQFSLLSVIQFVFTLFGEWNYRVFQHINAFCMPLLFYSGYKFLQFICDDLETVIYYILFFLGCAPLFLYVPFVYGEIISITFTMVLMWQTARYCKTGKKICLLWGTMAIVLACMVRKNSLIVLIAVGIVMVIHSMKKADLRGVVWILVMILAVSGSDRLVHLYYEKVSGVEVADGAPFISWVRMGLQDTWAGPGWFDNSSVEAFAEHGYNAEQTALAERSFLAEILNDMWEDKAGSTDFFRRKILSQWNSPGYNNYYVTENFDCGPEELPAFVRRIYYDDAEAVLGYMDRYQFVLYFYAAVSAVALFVDKKKRHCLAERLLYIAIIGGFLFSAMWEANSRYVLPYVVYMIPLAALGIGRLIKGIGQVQFFKKRYERMQNALKGYKNNTKYMEEGQTQKRGLTVEYRAQKDLPCDELY